MGDHISGIALINVYTEANHSLYQANQVLASTSLIRIYIPIPVIPQS